MPRRGPSLNQGPLMDPVEGLPVALAHLRRAMLCRMLFLRQPLSMLPLRRPKILSFPTKGLHGNAERGGLLHSIPARRTLCLSLRSIVNAG